MAAPLLEITQEQLFDYIKCPLYYDLKNNKKINVPNKIIFNNLLTEASNYFFSSLLNNKIPSEKKMKSCWDKICEKNKNMLSFNEIADGYSVIISFLRWAYDYKPVPVDMDSLYTIKIDGMFVYGRLPIILINKSNKYELFYIDFSKRKSLNTLENELSFKLKYSLAAYGFKSVYGKQVDVIKVLLLSKREIISTYKTDNDFKHLLYSLENIKKAINYNIYYPRENIYCPYCNFMNICKVVDR